MDHRQLQHDPASPAQHRIAMTGSRDDAMLRVSIASLLDATATPAASDGNGAEDLAGSTPVGRHGLIHYLDAGDAMSAAMPDFGLLRVVPEPFTPIRATVADALFAVPPHGPAPQLFPDPVAGLGALSHGAMPLVELVPLDGQNDCRLPDDVETADVGQGSLGGGAALADPGSALFDHMLVEPLGSGPGLILHGGPSIGDGGVTIGLHAHFDGFAGSPTPIVDLHLLA